MKTKNIKVAYSTRYNQRGTCTVPKIQVEGKWLEELGFTVGSKITVEYENGSLLIRPMSEEETFYLKQNELKCELTRKQQELSDLQSDFAAISKVAESYPNYNK